MNKESALYTLSIGATSVAALVFGTTLVHATMYAPERQAVVAATSSMARIAIEHNTVSSDDIPVRLRIPALSINANIQQVGLNTMGRMAVPSNFTDVAWYKYGVLPGQLGSAVIDGHVDNGLGLDGVFKTLGNIKVGDTLYIDTQGHNELKFLVTDIKSYPYTDVPTDIVFNQTDAKRLNLITCEGTWVPDQKTYNQRLVVFALLQ